MTNQTSELISCCCRAPVEFTGRTLFEESCCDPTVGYHQKEYRCTKCNRTSTITFTQEKENTRPTEQDDPLPDQLLDVHAICDQRDEAVAKYQAAREVVEKMRDAIEGKDARTFTNYSAVIKEALQLAERWLEGK